MDRRRIALWRYERIEDLLEETLTNAHRRALLRALARESVRWPSGEERPVSEASLYRWLHAFAQGGLEALEPRPHSPGDQEPLLVDPKYIEYAVDLLREEPERSLTILGKLLETAKGVTIPRSSLHRHLKRHPAYARLRSLSKASGRGRARRRFQAREPHHIWQCDSKGPFSVKLSDGRSVTVHVLTILDDFSRATLAYCVVERADLAAAVRVFVEAARRWGLPRKFYADRASIFDARTFRAALALLGVHRIRSRSRNAPARGKIEAFHRVLERWFIRELRHQVVVDVAHLGRLLAGVLESIYMERRHRGIHMPPREALSGRISERQVSVDRLSEAFLIWKRKRAHPKSGEVELAGILFKVPEDLRGQRLSFAYDPVDPEVAFVELTCGSRRRLKLAVEPPPLASPPAVEPRGTGRLQALYDHWQGRRLPQAEAGFGLPEIFVLLSDLIGRRVPRDEFEASTIQDFYRRKGPFSRKPLEAALKRILSRLGKGRALATYLEALSGEIARE